MTGKDPRTRNADSLPYRLCVGIMVLNMYRGAKRRRILKGLKQKAKDKKINDQKMNELLMEKFGVKDPQKEKKVKLDVVKVNMADEYSKN